MRQFRRVILFGCGALVCFVLSWCFAALGFGYVLEGAGGETSLFVLSPAASTLVGVVPLLGFLCAAVLCLALGIGLCAYGIVPPVAREQRTQS